MDFYDYFQTMPCNVRVLLRPSPRHSTSSEQGSKNFYIFRFQLSGSFYFVERIKDSGLAIKKIAIHPNNKFVGHDAK